MAKRCFSSDARGRRSQTSAELWGTYSVPTKSFPKAGCARSSAAGPSTISA